MFTGFGKVFELDSLVFYDNPAFRSVILILVPNPIPFVDFGNLYSGFFDVDSIILVLASSIADKVFFLRLYPISWR